MLAVVLGSNSTSPVGSGCCKEFIVVGKAEGSAFGRRGAALMSTAIVMSSLVAIVGPRWWPSRSSRRNRRVPPLHILQLHRGLSPPHQGDRGNPGSEARDPARAGLSAPNRRLALLRPRAGAPEANPPRIQAAPVWRSVDRGSGPGHNVEHRPTPPRDRFQTRATHSAFKIPGPLTVRCRRRLGRVNGVIEQIT